jgi:hypothetical protein
MSCATARYRFSNSPINPTTNRRTLQMPMKSAQEKIQELKQFIPNAQRAITQFEELLRRMESEESFRALWETDSAEALKAVGIDPEARQEMGREAYGHGPECNLCITPNGNACHC